MAVPSTISDLSVTAASNSPAGSDTVATNTGPDDYFRAISAIVRREQAQATATASATTVDLGAIATGNYVHITGTTTITGFGTVAAGIERTVVFDGALTLTHNSTSLILQGGANITTAAGDVAVFRSEGSGNWRCVSYEKASGIPVDSKLSTIAGLAVTDGNIIVGNGTTWVAESGATARTSLGVVAASDTTAGLVELATSAEVAAGTDTERAVTPSGLAASKIVSGTAVASTSGTAIDFTGIPAWAKRITLMFAGVSTSGTANPLVQIGDSGGIEETSYISSSSIMSTAVTSAAFTTAFGINSGAAGANLSGSIVLSLFNAATNTWAVSGVLSRTDAAITITVAGYKALSSVLTQLRITTVGGTDTFDSGTINIMYE